MLEAEDLREGAEANGGPCYKIKRKDWILQREIKKDHESVQWKNMLKLRRNESICIKTPYLFSALAPGQSKTIISQLPIIGNEKKYAKVQRAIYDGAVSAL